MYTLTACGSAVLCRVADAVLMMLPSEVLGAVISVLIIWVLTGVLVYAAIQRVITMDFEVDADIMIIISAIGVIMNIMSVSFHHIIMMMNDDEYHVSIISLSCRCHVNDDEYYICII